MQALHRVDDGLDVVLKPAAGLLAVRLQAHHAHARHGRWGAATVHAAAKGIVAVLRYHRDVVAKGHQLAQQVLGVHTHARNGREVTPGNKADSHAE